MKRLSLAMSIAALVFVATPAQAQVFKDQSVSAFANIFGAGQTDPTPAPAGYGGGVAAPVFDLNAGTGRILTFSSVTGTIQFTPPVNNILPDGVLTTGGTSYNHSGTYISSYGGISGITVKQGVGFLTGIFLSDAAPTVATTPGTLNFVNSSPLSGYVQTNFATLAPVLNQTFFIGDGLTGNGTGTQQKFYVPDGATRLYLGFADGYDYNSAPGAYYDNGGNLVASFSVTAVPEPETYALMLAGLGMLGFAARRKKQQAA